jgi:hypothetical protein
MRRTWKVLGSAAGAAALVLGGLAVRLEACAAERAALVADGPRAAATLTYTMGSESLLSADADPRFRVQADGDIATANHIAVVVPGVGHDASEFDTARPESASADGAPTVPESARAVREAAAAQAPGNPQDLAVVAWLGYPSPSILEAGLGSSALDVGAANLAEFQDFLRNARPDATVTWICHSYGSLVCASALTRADPDALVLVGSPGVQVDRADQLATDAPVYVAEGEDDLISTTKLMDVVNGSYGPDPALASFGAERIDCDPRTGHSDYFRAGSSQLAELAWISLNTASGHPET